MKLSTSTRLFCILATHSSQSVIFRRGPSKRVRLIRWDRTNDTLEHGQWFKGRIYERRCDLSPSGKYLLYFAADQKDPYHSWTAISKPPYLTALALWPKGDCWGGGGYFTGENSIKLNHLDHQMILAPEFTLKKHFKVRPSDHHESHGEDFPIYHTLLLKNHWEYIEEQYYEKSSAKKNRLRMIITHNGQPNQAWYTVDFKLFDTKNILLFELTDIDWADFDSNGDLVFAERGKLYRLPEKNFKQYSNEGEKVLSLIADLTNMQFEPMAPNKDAQVW